MNTLSTRRPSRADEARERAMREVRDEEPTARLNVQIPKSVLRELKLIATRHDRTVSDIVREFVTEYVRKNSGE